MSNNNRIEELDIARGIGLILVIWAHAKAPGSSLIYQFHMPFFFLLSGYLYNPHTSLKSFVKQRFLQLYIPFVFWNIAIITAILLQNRAYWPTFAYNFPRILFTLEKDGRFFGATWFLASLLIISLLYKLFETALQNIPHKKYYLLLLFLIGLCIGFMNTFPYAFHRTLILGGFYAIGAYLKEQNLTPQNIFHPFLFVISVIVFFMFAIPGSANMAENVYSSPISFIITSLTGSYVTICIAFLFNRYLSHLPIFSNLKKIVVYIGMHGKDLILFQFLGFWIVHALQNYISGNGFHDFLHDNAIGSTANGWWIVYFIVGLGFPLFFTFCLRKGPFHRLIEKLHII